MKDQEKDKPRVTHEKKCPACGSSKVQYQGRGTWTGLGPGTPTIQKYFFGCTSCQADFWYMGEAP